MRQTSSYARRMILSKLLRRWVSGGLLMAMLFMQLATAAYACPQPAQVRSGGAVMSTMSDMPDCAAMGANPLDEAQPLLCKAHCSQGVASTAAAAAPDLQPNPAATTLLLGIVLPTSAAPLAVAAAGQPRTPLRPPGAPPLYLLVLRN